MPAIPRDELSGALLAFGPQAFSINPDGGNAKAVVQPSGMERESMTPFHETTSDHGIHLISRNRPREAERRLSVKLVCSTLGKTKLMVVCTKQTHGAKDGDTLDGATTSMVGLVTHVREVTLGAALSEFLATFSNVQTCLQLCMLAQRRV